MSSLIKAVGLVRFADRRLLLVRSADQEAFYLPGGGIEPGETEREALHREVAEELGVVLGEAEFYARYFNDAVGRGAGVKVDLACYTGVFDGEPVASAEIAELGWFTRAEYEQHHVTAPAILDLYADLDPA
ncbi:NUDIX domain-containing protein [Saccharopolyspora sp. TS4A08]|uniref:NUDIX domain-containing protein n=1 Tax=Saccharopolyspora ipomoeae TaxID=3042027 RepID=A0ABT6PWZ4_9PSEU|nr:NUDIX domain-containing protein [Saccharopolyspora sp. TS4A08]MDI2032522.1 NUDIX domain-containing protein [Saccharopolyspora sp. TS4A08]